MLHEEDRGAALQQQLLDLAPGEDVALSLPLEGKVASGVSRKPDDG